MQIFHPCLEILDIYREMPLGALAFERRLPKTSEFGLHVCAHFHDI